MIESLLHRDRAIVISALTGMALLSWVYIFAGAGTGMPALHMSGLPTATHSGDAMLPMEPIPWTFNHALIIFVMWWLMMLATMLPSAALLALTEIDPPDAHGKGLPELNSIDASAASLSW